jgi:4-amino-4-deoxy-L-arabinose transferase-like glycosyltransferase
LNRKDPATVTLALLFLAGFLLRIYQIGADSFWIDEVGVAIAGSRPTLAEALEIARGHIMAMPLDYVVTWIFARGNTSEAFLRLPAALWGSFTLPVSYLYFRRLASQRVALIAVGLIAFSAIHIQYSQELRFYAALVFFYTLSSWLLLRAIQIGKVSGWLLFLVFTSLGIFFHVYVVLAVANGFAWLYLARSGNPDQARSRISLILSCFILLGVFLYAVITFGSGTAYDIPFLLYGDSFLTVLLTGLGWFPFYNQVPVLPWIWGGLGLALALYAVYQQVRRQPRGLIAAVVYSAAAQVVLISVFILFRNYFIAPRQVLFLLPSMMLLTALGLEAVGRFLYNAFSPDRLSSKRMIFVLAALLLVLNGSALVNYYQGDKGRAGEITNYLTECWQPGTQVLVIPSFEVLNYRYYSYQKQSGSQFYEALDGIEWDGLQEAASSGGSVYLIAQYPLPENQQQLLDSLAFQAVYIPETISVYSRSVWLRTP